MNDRRHSERRAAVLRCRRCRLNGFIGRDAPGQRALREKERNVVAASNRLYSRLKSSASLTSSQTHAGGT